VIKFADTAADDEDAKSADTASLARRILEAAELVHRTLDSIAKSEAKDSQQKVEKKEEMKADLTAWVPLMKNFRFGEVKEFQFQHFWKSAKDQTSAPQRAFQRRLQSEFSDLYKSLPLLPDSSVFMRVQEGNLSLAQVMITAPIDTPYSRGAFLFDVFFPNEYPNVPPKVNLQTTGNNTFRFNPNLYQNGYVCLSLLNTWNGSKEEKWNPKTSTFLQVCVSVQSLIFVPTPYFNEPGYESNMNTPDGKDKSNEYNSNVRNATIRFAMLDMIEKPPVGFEYMVLSHFFLQRDNLIKQVDGWLKDGVSKGSNLQTLTSLVSELKGALHKLEMPKPPKLEDEDE
jgi:ubiquitin-protein ligase